MAAYVRLQVVCGSLEQTQYVFDRPGCYVIGRAQDCQLRVPHVENHKFISQRHCALDLDPPAIVLHDLGSSHGTFVNKRRLASQAELPGGFPLVEGDEVCLGNPDVGEVVVFRVHAGSLEATTVTAASAGGSRRCADCAEPLDADTETCCDPLCRARPSRAASELLLAAGRTPGLKALRDYELKCELGRGGMGAVFLLHSVRGNEAAALKIMLPRMRLQSDQETIFRREMSHSLALSHPNIVRSIAAGSHQNTMYLLMEFCPGRSLATLSPRSGRVSTAQALDLIGQVLDGLDYLHRAFVPANKLRDGSRCSANGLVHRDIKPANLLLVRQGTGMVLKISDFGLTKAFALAGLSGVTGPSQVAGTFAYMSRWQLLQYRDARPEVDVWAAAATLYFLLSGRTPRDFGPAHKDQADQVRIVRDTPVVPIQQRDPSVPARLAQILDMALDDQAPPRFRSAVELKWALQEFMSPQRKQG